MEFHFKSRATPIEITRNDQILVILHYSQLLWSGAVKGYPNSSVLKLLYNEEMYKYYDLGDEQWMFWCKGEALTREEIREVTSKCPLPY